MSTSLLFITVTWVLRTMGCLKQTPGHDRLTQIPGCLLGVGLRKAEHGETGQKSASCKQLVPEKQTRS